MLIEGGPVGRLGNPEESQGERNSAAPEALGCSQLAFLAPRSAAHNSAGMPPGFDNSGYSYRKASAGRMREADQEGYSVATKETSSVKTAIQTPSARRGAKGT